MDSSNITNIVKYIIRNTPFGHLKETIENIKNLVGASIFEEKDIQDELKAYEEEHFKQVNLNDDKIIMSKFNKDSEDFYYDQSKNLKIMINPLSENIEKISEIEGENNSFAEILNKFLIEYRDKSYKSGVCAVNSNIIY
jgi:capping protein alpha